MPGSVFDLLMTGRVIQELFLIALWWRTPKAGKFEERAAATVRKEQKESRQQMRKGARQKVRTGVRQKVRTGVRQKTQKGNRSPLRASFLWEL